MGPKQNLKLLELRDDLFYQNPANGRRLVDFRQARAVRIARQLSTKGYSPRQIAAGLVLEGVDVTEHEVRGWLAR